jgi:hypothetical protein
MALKFNFKDFDYKAFFLKNGEWIGLGIALIVALPLLGMGLMKVATSPSPVTVSNDIKTLASNADKLINDSVPTEDIKQPTEKFAPEVFTVLNFEPINPEKYDLDMPFIVMNALEDTKRRQPEILTPGEFHADYIRGGVKGWYIINDSATGRLQMFVLHDKEQSPTPSQLKRMERLKKYYAKLGIQMPAAGGGGGGGMGGKGGGGMGGKGAGGPMGGMGGMGGPMGGMGGMGGMMGMAGGMMGMGGGMMGGMGGGGKGSGGGMLGAAGQRKLVRELKLVDADKIDKDPQATLAEFVYPVRMVQITGTFPFRDQLERFRQALRKKSIDEMLSANSSEAPVWEFKGFEIERQVRTLDGTRVIRSWEPYSKVIASGFEQYVRRVPEAESFPAESPLRRFEGIVNKGLVMPRLPLVPPEEIRYPDTEMKIEGIKETISAMEKLGKQNVKLPESMLVRRIKGGDGNEFDPYDPEGQLHFSDEPKKDKEPEKPATSTDKKKEESEMELQNFPEKALIQITDVTVVPGHTYEYRLKVRMANPNYKQTKSVAYKSLAKEAIIVADNWTTVPPVKVPYDTSWYVTNDKPQADHVAVEIHEWVPSIKTDPADKGELTRAAVASWVIKEKETANLGEYVGKQEKVEVPIWKTEDEAFQLAVNLKTREKKLPVDFTVQAGTGEPDLLVDFDGGKGARYKVGAETIAEDSSLDLLVLSADGKLRLRDAKEDIDNAERKQRYDDWKKFIQETRLPKERRTATSQPGNQNQGLFDQNRLPRGGGGDQ